MRVPVLPIRGLDVIPLRLPFRSEFRISRGSVGSPLEGAPHVFVRIVGEGGLAGWGEARPSQRWSYETVESVVSTVRQYLAPALAHRDAFDLAGAHRVMDTEIAPGTTTGQPIAKSAVDMALHDLIGHATGCSLASLFGSKQLNKLRLGYICTQAEPDAAAEAAAQAWARGYRCFKVKIGIDPANDEAVLRAIAEAVGTLGAHPFLWADANQAYTPTEAIKLVRVCERLGYDVLEQPLPTSQLTELARLMEAADLPIALDESIVSPADVLEVLRRGPLDCAVIKVAKSGGLYPARRIIELCRDAGVQLLGSGLTESRFALAASAQLYAAYGIEQLDLNGPQFLGDDPLPGLPSEQGPEYAVGEQPGVGLALSLEKLERYRVA